MVNGRLRSLKGVAQLKYLRSQVGVMIKDCKAATQAEVNMNQRDRAPVFLVSGLLVVLALLTACTAVGEGSQAAGPADEVTIQLSWLPDVEFTGFYTALDRGFYADEGLDVTLQHVQFDENGVPISSIDVVTGGEAQFGVVDGGVLLEARESGAPIVAIATIYQRHPLALTSLAENEIVQPQDLVGKTVHVSFVSQTVYNALLASQEIDPAEVNTVERTDFTIQPLLTGEADVIDAWVTNEVVDLELEGYEVNTILPFEYGIAIYPDVIFTTEDLIASNPDLVARFLAATLRGMRTAIDEPEYAAELTLNYDDTLSAEKLDASMFRSLPLLNPAGSQPGLMTADVWETTHQILLDQKMLAGPLDVTEAYTMEFLNAYYGE
ncbi:MAG TPA: hypothetical protein ENI95_12770 [Chloroflexi bacterium]|nr:hypothetical protein [Chloroflexota bacterium]